MEKEATRLVLVVEDEPPVRRPLARILELHGFSVIFAETSDEGVEAIKKPKVIAAIVDLRLRRGTGRDVIAAAPAHLPILIFSGVPSESAELERSRPHTRLVDKPVSPIMIVKTLEEMLVEARQA